MQFPRSIKAAGLVIAAVLLGLLAVQGTHALWSSTAAAAPGTVTGADFTVNLLGSPSGQSTTMTLPDGSAGSLALTTSASPAADLTPSAPVYLAVTASNNTNAGGAFDIRLTAGQPTIIDTEGSSVGQYLKVSAATGTSPAACPAASGYTELGASGYTTAALAKGASAVVCFKVHMAPATPSALAGQSANISVPLTAAQICGVPSGCA
jgi:predicted ribosomally synthesized peptide with SipW-like signal peptide